MHKEVPCSLPKPLKSPQESQQENKNYPDFSSVFILMTLKYQQYQPNSLGREVETAIM